MSVDLSSADSLLLTQFCWLTTASTSTKKASNLVQSMYKPYAASAHGADATAAHVSALAVTGKIARAAKPTLCSQGRQTNPFSANFAAQNIVLQIDTNVCQCSGADSIISDRRKHEARLQRPSHAVNATRPAPCRRARKLPVFPPHDPHILSCRVSRVFCHGD